MAPAPERWWDMDLAHPTATVPMTARRLAELNGAPAFWSAATFADITLATSRNAGYGDVLEETETVRRHSGGSSANVAVAALWSAKREWALSSVRPPWWPAAAGGR